MRLMVIGGAGYVGSHFVFEALRAGHEVCVYDNLSRGHRAAIPSQANFVHGDIRDISALGKAISLFEPEAILHYAAYALVGESVSSPELYYGNNIEGTRSLVEALVGLYRSEPAKSPVLVFSSTCAIFGSPDSLPVHEEVVKNPESPYGFTKLACENLLRDACKAYGIKAMALRYFNACGADRSGLIGELHEPETHLIPNVLRSLQAEKTLSLFGNDYPTKDGSCIRDYVHVTDLAISHLAACQYLVKADAGVFETINLGTGNGYSNLEIMKMAGDIVGKKLKFEASPRRPGDAVALYADNAKAKSLLGFQTEHSSIENILRTAWKFVENGEKPEASSFDPGSNE